MSLDISQDSVQAESDQLAAHRKRGLFFIGLAVAAAGFTLCIQIGVNSNFVAQTIGASGLQAGILEASRETCGITALGLLALLAGLAEPLVAAVMLALFGIGITSYAFAPNYIWVVMLSLVWSQGLHVWMPLPNSMTIALAEKNRVGYRLGQMQKYGAFGSAIGVALALSLIYMHRQNIFDLHLLQNISWIVQKAGLEITSIGKSDPLRDLLIIAGIVGLIGAFACLFIPRGIKTPGPRVVFRKSYGLYYVMCFLEGWRKQIFLCFAGFMLVKIYNTDLLTMFILAGTVQAFGWFFSPQIGKLIDRIGERKVLQIYYILMILVFIGYTLVQNVYVLYGLFIADGAFFSFAMAITTYVSRIAPKNEHTPALSAGVAMNHVAAVATPLISGFLWQLGFQWVFVFGTAAAVTSIFVVMKLPKHLSQDAPFVSVK